MTTAQTIDLDEGARAELAIAEAEEARLALVRELMREVRTGYPPAPVLDGGPDTPEAVARRRRELVG